MVFGSLGFLLKDFRFLVDTDSRSRVGLTILKRTRLAGWSAIKVIEDLATVVAEAGNLKAGYIGYS